MLTNRQLFLKSLAQTSQSPLLLEIVEAEGLYMYDLDHKKYIDLISGIGVSSVGHRHPKVVEAIKNQVDKHLHLMVYGEFIQHPQVRLAEALCNTLPSHLDSVYLLNSGSEAIEGAMKLAKRHTGRYEIISCFNGYHGSSHGALSLSSCQDFKQKYRPFLPGISHIRFGCIDDLSLITEKTAAFVVETVQGEAGVKVAEKSYWEAVRKQCEKTGTLLILDEIQCGFGRTGKLWAFEHYALKPDILVCAKAMGGGMPISCFIANKKIMHDLSFNPILGHISTFGGHPVSSAAALATLQIIFEEKLMNTAKEKELLFKKILKHKAIKEFRSLGLMIAIEFESFNLLQKIIHHALEMGIVTDWFLFNNCSMRISPPLTIGNHEIELVCKKILKAIDLSLSEVESKIN